MSFQPSPPDVFPSAGQGNGSLRRGGFIQIAGYEIEGEIGRGGMATVYRATQQSLGRQVALKVLARELDENDEFALRFKKEGRILARLLHPNIVTIHDIGISEDHRLFLSVEYLSGGTLRDRLKRGLSFDSAIHIIRCVAKALGYAHDKGVVHRDVKPSNIMFRHDDTPVLTDFGVARVAGSNTVHTMTGLMVGSPGYMSPEQAMGESATIQSDLYGLGVVFYEMLTGHPPYQADNPLAVMLKHVHEPAPKLPREHADLQPIMDKLLAKKATDRYRNAGEFLSALNSVVPGDTGSQPGVVTGAGYPSVVELTSGTLRRLFKNRSRASIWVGVIGATLLVIVIVHTFRSRDSTERVEVPPESARSVARPAPVSRETEIAELLQQAEAHLKAGQLTDEAEQNAEAAYRRVLKLDRGNARALAGLENIAREYERLARRHLEAGAPQDSLDPIQKGLAVAPGREELLRLRREAEQRIAERNARAAEQERLRQARVQAEEFLAQAQSSFQENSLEVSLAHIEQGLLAVPDHPGLLALRERVKTRMAEQARQEAEAARRRQEADRYLAQAVESQRNGGYATSLQHIERGLAAVPNHEELLRLREAVRSQLAAEQQRQAEQARREQEIKALLRQADGQMQAKRLTEPAGNNAEASYRQVLKLDANNAQAQAGLERIAQDYLQQARQRQSAGALPESLKLIEQGLTVVPNQWELLRLREEVARGIAEAKARQEREEEQRRQAERFLTEAQSRLREGSLEVSLTQIEQGLQIIPNHRELLALREQVKARLAEQQRQAEARRQQEEAERQKAEQARQQAEIARQQAEAAERQKAEQARQQAEMARRRQEAEQLLARAMEFQRDGQYAEGLQQAEKGLALAPDHAELLRLREAMRAQLAAEQQRQAEQAKREQEIKALLKQADGQMQAKRLTEPAGNSAEASYRQVLKLEAGNAQAQAGLERIAQDYLQQARQRQSAGTLQESLKLIEKGLTVVPNQPELLRLREEVRSQLAAEQQKLEQQRLEQQRLEQQRKEQQRLEQQLQDQLRQDEKQRQEQQRKEQKRLEQQRQEEKQREQQKNLDQQQRQEEKQRQEQQRKLEQQRLEQQRKEQQRLEQQRLEQQQRQEQQRKLEQQQQEQQRLEQQRKEQPQPETTTKPRVFGTF